MNWLRNKWYQWQGDRDGGKYSHIILLYAATKSIIIIICQLDSNATLSSTSNNFQLTDRMWMENNNVQLCIYVYIFTYGSGQGLLLQLQLLLCCSLSTPLYSNLPSQTATHATTTCVVFLMQHWEPNKENITCE